jgi:hypothetical protein
MEKRPTGHEVKMVHAGITPLSLERRSFSSGREIGQRKARKERFLSGVSNVDVMFPEEPWNGIMS